jgi:hypothetical protein
MCGMPLAITSPAAWPKRARPAMIHLKRHTRLRVDMFRGVWGLPNCEQAFFVCLRITRHRTLPRLYPPVAPRLANFESNFRMPRYNRTSIMISADDISRVIRAVPGAWNGDEYTGRP